MAHDHYADPECGCWCCQESLLRAVTVMVLCPTCGFKRCPRATDCCLPCSGSDDNGQPGSAYEHGTWGATLRRADPTTAVRSRSTLRWQEPS